MENQPSPWEPPAGDPPELTQLAFVNSDLDTFEGGMVSYIKTHGYWAWLWFFVALDVVATIVVALVAPTVLSVNFFNNPTNFLGVLVAPSIIAMVPFFVFVTSKMKKQFFEHFAMIMGYFFSQSAALSTMSGYLFTLGHDRLIRDVFSGSYQNRPIRIFNYSLAEGYGKGEHRYDYSVMEIECSPKVPQMQLVSVTIVPLFPFFFQHEGEEGLQLEGDFNKYFSLHAPKGTEIEDLQIFSPDVMQALIDHYPRMNFECNNGKAYVYIPSGYGSYGLRSRRDFYALYAEADFLMKRLSRFENEEGLVQSSD